MLTKEDVLHEGNISLNAVAFRSEEQLIISCRLLTCTNLEKRRREARIEEYKVIQRIEKIENKVS